MDMENDPFASLTSAADDASLSNCEETREEEEEEEAASEGAVPLVDSAETAEQQITTSASSISLHDDEGLHAEELDYEEEMEPEAEPEGDAEPDVEPDVETEGKDAETSDRLGEEEEDEEEEGEEEEEEEER